MGRPVPPRQCCMSAFCLTVQIRSCWMVTVGSLKVGRDVLGCKRAKQDQIRPRKGRDWQNRHLSYPNPLSVFASVSPGCLDITSPVATGWGGFSGIKGNLHQCFPKISAVGLTHLKQHSIRTHLDLWDCFYPFYYGGHHLLEYLFGVFIGLRHSGGLFAMDWGMVVYVWANAQVWLSFASKQK